MGLRLGAGVALVAVALLGFTVATPQDAAFGLKVDVDHLFDFRGANAHGLKDVDPQDQDLGRLLDRIDGSDLDPNLVRNLDPAALAKLLEDMDSAELAALGLTAAQAQDYIDRLRDPDLTEEQLADIAADLSDKGLMFANDDADGRFDAGEAAYADVDGDGKVSEGDVRLGVLALLLGVDRGLSDADHDRLLQYEFAGGLGLGRPASAQTRSGATAATSPLAADAYPTDRAMGPVSAVCVQATTPSLTCHSRTFVHGAVEDAAGTTLFRLAPGTGWTRLVPDPTAAGPLAHSSIQVVTAPQAFVAVPTLTPADVLVGTGGSDVDLYRDGNGMVWLASPSGPPQTLHLDLTWAVDLGYFDLPVAADVTKDDVPSALRPALDATSRAIGGHIASLAAADGRTYGDSVRALAGFVRDFGIGQLPDREEESSDLLAAANAQVGCARQRAEVFTVAAQSLGIPAHLVVNEAHAFSEVYVPRAGWHLVDVGGCSRMQVHALPGHEEVMALQDLPYADEDAPPSQADTEQEPVTTTIDITQLPPSLRRDADFSIAGTVASPAGKVPAGVPITFTYNRTKEQPGTPFCSTQTAGDGTYRATCRLGSGTPAGSLQLVARLAPSVVAGAPSAPSYSDPPFVVQKATKLTVVGNARTSADVPVAYTALVRDEDGAAVAQRAVTLAVDGGDPVTKATDATGRARFTLQLKPGKHTLSGALAGDDAYDPSSGSLQVEATTTRIALQVDQASLDQGTLVIDGALAVGATPTAGRTVTATWRNDPDGPAKTLTATTGGNGRFHFAFDGTPRPGPGLVTVAEKSGVAADVAFGRSVDATATVEAPPRWALGNPVPVTVRIRGPLDPVPLRVLLDGAAVADLDVGEQLPGEVPIVVPFGLHTVSLEAGTGVRLSSQPARVLSAPVESTLAAVEPTPAGSALVVRGTLRFDGHGLETPLQLRLQGTSVNGTSASDGTFSLALPLPADQASGNATALLTLPDVGHHLEVPVRILRQARLRLEVPGVSFHAFGTTRIVVAGEGNATTRVTVDGKARPCPVACALDVDTSTFAWRKVTVHATSEPKPGADVTPATLDARMVVVNPATLAGGPLMLAAVAVATWRATRFVQARIAHRNRFLPARPRGPVQVLQPELPRRVPLVFDPAVDQVLVLRLPRALPWRVRLDGAAAPAQVQGRTVRVDLAHVAPGVHELRFTHERRSLRLAFGVADLRSALDQATLDLMARIGQAQPWPATLQALQDGLRQAGAHPDDAQAVRGHAEESLYTMDGFGRDRFHAFFAALDAAQARKRRWSA